MKIIHETATKEIRRSIEKLWQSTFGDSDEYISLLFDNYYTRCIAKIIMEKDKLIASLIGIPYQFKIENHKINGLYLCGLSTLPSFRNQGLMSKLIEEIKKTAVPNFEFLFLIPAENYLVKFYQKRGFQINSYKYSFTLRNPVLKAPNLTIKERIIVLSYNNLKETEKQKISKFIRSCEDEINGNHIQHSLFDIENILKENNLSDGVIGIQKTKSGEIKSLMLLNNDDLSVKIKKIFPETIDNIISSLTSIISVRRDISKIELNLYEGKLIEGFTEKIKDYIFLDQLTIYQHIYSMATPIGKDENKNKDREAKIIRGEGPKIFLMLD